MNTKTSLSAMNERLILVLESSRQVAFDWQITDDRLVFSGLLAGSPQGTLLDASRPWHSKGLPELVHAEDLAHFRSELHAALKSKDDNVLHRVEIRLRDASGKWRWIEITGKIVARNDNGRASRMAGTFSDIHERKQAERQSARLRDLYATLSQANQAIVRSVSSDSLFTSICRITVEHGRFQSAWIGITSDDENDTRLAAVASAGTTKQHAPPLVGELQPQGMWLAEAAVRDNKPQVQNDVLSTHPALASAIGHERSRLSIASFPFQLSGKPYGALTLCSEDADFFGPALLSLIEELSRNISFALENFERESRRKAMETALLESEKFKSAILTAALDCIVSVNLDGEILSFNQAAESTFGYRSADVLGKKFSDILVPLEWHMQIMDDIKRFYATGESTILNRRIELTAIHADGSCFPAEVAVVPLSGHVSHAFTAFIRDISEQKRAEAMQTGQNHILNLVATGAPLRDILVEIVRLAEQQASHAHCSILLLNQQGTKLSGRISQSLPQAYLSQLDETLVGPCNDSCGTAVYRAAPVSVTDIATDPLWAATREHALASDLKACTSWPILGKNRKVLGTFALYYRQPGAPAAEDLEVFSACTRLAGIAIESRASEEKMRYLAHYDGLTSLPNRFLFREYLDLALRNSKRNGKKFAVLFLDLDKFKEINDTLGHDAGDHVLREVAKRMRNCLRHTDKIARMGGDEFYVLVEDLIDGRYAADVAQKLLEAASRPIEVCGEVWQLSVSIGIAIYPDDGSELQALLQHADSAMYRAKDKGKNGYQFFSRRADAEADTLTVLNRHAAILRREEPALRAG